VELTVSRDFRCHAPISSLGSRAAVTRSPPVPFLPRLSSEAHLLLRLVKRSPTSIKTNFSGYSSLKFEIFLCTVTPHAPAVEEAQVSEIELRRMIEHALGYRRDHIEGRWVIETRYRRQRWAVIVEPIPEKSSSGWLPPTKSSKTEMNHVDLELTYRGGRPRRGYSLRWCSSTPEGSPGPRSDVSVS